MSSNHLTTISHAGDDLQSLLMAAFRKAETAPKLCCSSSIRAHVLGTDTNKQSQELRSRIAQHNSTTCFFNATEDSRCLARKLKRFGLKQEPSIERRLSLMLTEIQGNIHISVECRKHHLRRRTLTCLHVCSALTNTKCGAT